MPFFTILVPRVTRRLILLHLVSQGLVAAPLPKPSASPAVRASVVVSRATSPAIAHMQLLPVPQSQTTAVLLEVELAWHPVAVTALNAVSLDIGHAIAPMQQHRAPLASLYPATGHRARVAPGPP